MSPKTIAVVGATGGQGGSVVDSFLGAGYAVRAITRNASSPKASALKERGVEVVTADLNDLDSLVKAFEVSLYPAFSKFMLSLLTSTRASTLSSP
jgi:NAD(P)-dependent dehydrogenase (short-subunit alcohol dehydrogenase family)